MVKARPPNLRTLVRAVLYRASLTVCIFATPRIGSLSGSILHPQPTRLHNPALTRCAKSPQITLHVAKDFFAADGNYLLAVARQIIKVQLHRPREIGIRNHREKPRKLDNAFAER